MQNQIIFEAAFCWLSAIADKATSFSSDNWSKCAEDIRVSALAAVELLQSIHREFSGGNKSVPVSTEPLECIGRVYYSLLKLSVSKTHDLQLRSALEALRSVNLAVCRSLSLSVVYPILGGCAAESVFCGSDDECRNFVRKQKQENPSTDFIICQL